MTDVEERSITAWDTSRIVLAVMCTLVAVAVTVSIWIQVTYATGQREIQECLQVQVADLQTSYIAGREAARQDRQAQRELLLALDQPGAVQRYLERLDEADRGRLAAPPPTLSCL